MKKILGITLLAGLLSLTAVAQDTTTNEKSRISKAGSSVKKGSKKAWKGTKKGAKAAGDETAELATKGKAKVTDKKRDEWVGPNNETIYVDDNSKYYWISEKGKRMFVAKEELKKKG